MRPYNVRPMALNPLPSPGEVYLDNQEARRNGNPREMLVTDVDPERGVRVKTLRSETIGRVQQVSRAEYVTFDRVNRGRSSWIGLKRATSAHSWHGLSFIGNLAEDGNIVFPADGVELPVNVTAVVKRRGREIATQTGSDLVLDSVVDGKQGPLTAEVSSPGLTRTYRYREGKWVYVSVACLRRGGNGWDVHERAPLDVDGLPIAV